MTRSEYKIPFTLADTRHALGRLLDVCVAVGACRGDRAVCVCRSAETAVKCGFAGDVVRGLDDVCVVLMMAGWECRLERTDMLEYEITRLC